MSAVAEMKLACRGCGASLGYSAKDQSLKCQYCGTITEIPKAEDELPDQPKVIIPLTVEASELVDAVYEHLASGDLTPDHLLEHATFTKTERFYVPTYAYTGEFEAKWTASFGFDRKEPYTDWVTQTENGRSRKVPVTKYRTVTDWSPVNGTDAGSFGVYGYAGERLYSATVSVTSIVEGGTGGEVVEYDPSYTTGIEVEAFASPAEKVYADRAKPQVNEIIERSVMQHAQGDHQKDWHWTAQVSKESLTALVPVCHAAYEFEGKTYHVWTSGANSSRLLADALPVDAQRKNALNISFLPVVVAVASAAFAIFKFDVAWTVPSAAAGAALLFGFLRKNAIVDHSRRLRKSLLASKKAASANTAGMTSDQQKKLVQSVQRPAKSFLAKTAFDAWLIPLLALLAGLAPFAPLAHFSAGGSAAPSSNYARSEPLPKLAEAPTAPGPAVAVAQAPAPEPAQQASSAAPESTSQATQSTASDQSQRATAAASPSPSAGAQPPAPGTAHVASLVQQARAGNWAGVDAEVRSMLAEGRSTAGGDASVRRAANTEGLEALKRGDAAAATVAFERGAKADPSNVEVRNNYAYALMKAQRPNDAVKVLLEVLGDAPNRTSAWANLSEAAAAGNQDVATVALKLAVHFSANRERTVTAFNKVLETTTDQAYKGVVQAVLRDAEQIPAFSSAQATVQSAPSTVPPGPASQVETAARQMLADSRSCFDQKQYACAITNAQNALRLVPESQQAMQLKQAAESAQAQALKNIQIN